MLGTGRHGRVGLWETYKKLVTITICLYKHYKHIYSNIIHDHRSEIGILWDFTGFLYPSNLVRFFVAFSHEIWPSNGMILQYFIASTLSVVTTLAIDHGSMAIEMVDLPIVKKGWFTPEFISDSLPEGFCQTCREKPCTIFFERFESRRTTLP